LILKVQEKWFICQRSVSVKKEYTINYDYWKENEGKCKDVTGALRKIKSGNITLF
jgi:hypothetical protein